MGKRLNLLTSVCKPWRIVLKVQRDRLFPGWLVDEREGTVNQAGLAQWGRLCCLLRSRRPSHGEWDLRLNHEPDVHPQR